MQSISSSKIEGCNCTICVHLTLSLLSSFERLMKTLFLWGKITLLFPFLNKHIGTHIGEVTVAGFIVCQVVIYKFLIPMKVLNGLFVMYPVGLLIQSCQKLNKFLSNKLFKELVILKRLITKYAWYSDKNLIFRKDDHIDIFEFDH